MQVFDFISLFVVIFALDSVSSQIQDSYTIGIQQKRNENPLGHSKWSKNELSGDYCGGIFREKQVLIKSPHYPHKYPKNANCEYIFYSPFVCVNEFHIQFLDFQLEPSLSCSKDKVIIGADEVLCGQVIGIMKYKAINGTLRIKFMSDDTMETKGFKLLVTRLPCSLNESTDENVHESMVSSTFQVHPAPALQPDNVITIEPAVVNTISNMDSESVPETTIAKPICSNSQMQSNGIWPYSAAPTTPIAPTIPSCCINVYNQKSFYLISPAFPNAPQFPSNCLFYVERFHPNICRLRIEFKYFLLGDWQANQCSYSFVEIDGRRFCGCQTGFVYYTQWGDSPKSIRFTNTPLYRGIQGFVLEITQEECPYRSITLPGQRYTVSRQPPTPTINHFLRANDPRRCSFNYMSWFNFNTNHALLAKSICIRNFG